MPMADLLARCHMMSIRESIAYLAFLVFLVACDYREDLSYTPPATPTPTEETVHLQELRVRVVDRDGMP